MTPEAIKQAREIIDAATPGPWSDRETFLEERISNHFDIVFIAAARTEWPKALDEIERYQKSSIGELYCEIESLQEANKWYSQAAKIAVGDNTRQLLEVEKLRAVADAAKKVCECWPFDENNSVLEETHRDLNDALEALDQK